MPNSIKLICVSNLNKRKIGILEISRYLPTSITKICLFSIITYR